MLIIIYADQCNSIIHDTIAIMIMMYVKWQIELRMCKEDGELYTVA